MKKSLFILIIVSFITIFFISCGENENSNERSIPVYEECISKILL